MKKIVLIGLISFLPFIGNSQCTTQITVDSVSVLPNGDVIVAWQASPDVGIVSYDIFVLNPFTSANDSLNSTSTSNLSFVIPYDTIVLYQIEEIGVVANCGVGVGISPVGNNYHNTMLLKSQIDICNASVNLSWNAYDDFNSGTSVLYQIYVSVNGSSYSLSGTTNSLNYIHSGLLIGSNYKFFVRAIENNGVGPITSSSNIVNVSGNFLKTPNFLYLYTATVIDTSNIMVQFYADTAADIRRYIVKRSTSYENVFTQVGSITDYNGMDPLIEYYDEDVEAKNNFYTYQIEAENQCNQVKITSNNGRTIQLSVVPDEVAATNFLTWNFYDGWIGGVLEYRIYRQSKDNLTFELIKTIPASLNQNTFTDYVDNEIIGTGEFCYKVEAIEKNTVHVGNISAASSLSNEYCVKHNPLIYIGNAFEPKSLFNPVFKPSAILFDLSSYLFVIYDRWGHKMFETNDRNLGWNGQLDNSGEMLPMGAYVYLIKIKSNNGDEIQRRGMVTLIR